MKNTQALRKALFHADPEAEVREKHGTVFPDLEKSFSSCVSHREGRLRL